MPGLLLRLVTALVLVILVSVATTILKQLFRRNVHKPPVVWHWVPWIGSTVDYGKDPYKFFFKCRKKVGNIEPVLSLWCLLPLTESLVWRPLHVRSTWNESHGLPWSKGQ